jgi:hypothetical protein
VLFEAQGLRIAASCSSNGFTAKTTVEHAVMTIQGAEPSGFFFDSIQNSALNSGFILNPAGTDAAAAGVITYTPLGSNTVITVNYSATRVESAPQGDCVFVGTVIVA